METNPYQPPADVSSDPISRLDDDSLIELEEDEIDHRLRNRPIAFAGTLRPSDFPNWFAPDGWWVTLRQVPHRAVEVLGPIFLLVALSVMTGPGRMFPFCYLLGGFTAIPGCRWIRAKLAELNPSYRRLSFSTLENSNEIRGYLDRTGVGLISDYFIFKFSWSMIAQTSIGVRMIRFSLSGGEGDGLWLPARFFASAQSYQFARTMIHELQGGNPQTWPELHDVTNLTFDGGNRLSAEEYCQLNECDENRWPFERDGDRVDFQVTTAMNDRSASLRSRYRWMYLRSYLADHFAIFLSLLVWLVVERLQFGNWLFVQFDGYCLSILVPAIILLGMQAIRSRTNYRRHIQQSHSYRVSIDHSGFYVGHEAWHVWSRWQPAHRIHCTETEIGWRNVESPSHRYTFLREQIGPETASDVERLLRAVLSS